MHQKWASLNRTTVFAVLPFRHQQRAVYQPFCSGGFRIYLRTILIFSGETKASSSSRPSRVQPDRRGRCNRRKPAGQTGDGYAARAGGCIRRHGWKHAPFVEALAASGGRLRPTGGPGPGLPARMIAALYGRVAKSTTRPLRPCSTVHGSRVGDDRRYAISGLPSVCGETFAVGGQRQHVHQGVKLRHVGPPPGENAGRFQPAVAGDGRRNRVSLSVQRPTKIVRSGCADDCRPAASVRGSLFGHQPSDEPTTGASGCPSSPLAAASA